MSDNHLNSGRMSQAGLCSDSALLRFVGQPHVPYKEGLGRVTGDATFPTDGDGRLGVSVLEI